MRLLGVVTAVFLMFPAMALAQVVITEVMYDLSDGSDSGREWIEVSNAGAVPVMLTDWTVIENGKKHKITAILGDKALAPAAYAVIADNAEKFKTDHPGYAGQLFDSAFSLNNSGETLSLRDTAGIETEPLSYSSSMGGNGTGDSLQRSVQSGTALVPGIPTPGTLIPASGLAKTPQKAKVVAAKSTAKPKASPAPAPAIEIKGTTTQKSKSVSENQLAAAVIADPHEPAYLWWLAVFAIASFSAAGVALARHARKGEWEIEEIA